MDYIIDVDYNITKAEANARKLNREIEVSRKEAARIKEEISNTTAALEQERQKQQQIREEVSAQTKEAAKLSDIIDRIKKGTASTSEIIDVGGLDQAQARLASLERNLREQEKLYDKCEKNARKLTAQLTKQELSLEKQNNKTADLGDKIRANTVNQDRFTKANNNTQKSIKKSSTAMTNFGKRIGNILKSVFIFTVLTKILTQMRDALTGYLSQDRRLSKSVEQLKTNLSTIGATIMSSLAPVIQWVVDKLIYVTALLGNILAKVLGKDIKQMQALAQATDDTAEAAKKATASFDTLQTIDTSSNDSAASTKMPIEVELALEKAEKDANTFVLKLQKFFEPMKAEFREFANPIAESFEESYYSIEQSTNELWSKIKGAFIGLWENHLKPIWDTIKIYIQNFFGESLSGIEDFFAQAAENGEELGLIIQGIGAIFSFIWSIVGPILESVIGGIGNVLKTTNDVIFSIIGAIGHLFGFIKEMFAGLKALIQGDTDEAVKHFKKAWGHLVNVFVNVGNAIIGVINNLWSLIFDAFKGTVNAIGGMVAEIGSWLGFDWDLHWDAKVPLIPEIPEYVPELATGAVIPGGSPFLAWLGDQPKGQTNIETPLDTMVEAFKIAQATQPQNINLTATGSLAPLVRLLKLEIDNENNRSTVF